MEERANDLKKVIQNFILDVKTNAIDNSVFKLPPLI